MKKKYIFYILAFLIFLAAYVRLNMYEYRKQDLVFYRINRITGSISLKLINQKKWISLEIKSEPEEKTSEKKTSDKISKQKESDDSIDRELIDKDLQTLKNEKPKKAVPPNPFP